MYQEDQLFTTAVLPLKMLLNTWIFCLSLEDGSSYIKDTRDFLKKIKRLGKIPEGAILVTVDIVGLYSNIPHDLGLKSLRKRINETGIL